MNLKQKKIKAVLNRVRIRKQLRAKKIKADNAFLNKKKEIEIKVNDLIKNIKTLKSDIDKKGNNMTYSDYLMSTIAYLNDFIQNLYY